MKPKALQKSGIKTPQIDRSKYFGPPAKFVMLKPKNLAESNRTSEIDTQPLISQYSSSKINQQKSPKFQTENKTQHFYRKRASTSEISDQKENIPIGKPIFIQEKNATQTPTMPNDLEINQNLNRFSKLSENSIDPETKKTIPVMNLIAELRKTISNKDLEILTLKREKMKAEMEAEELMREMKSQAKEYESLKISVSDSRLCKSCYNILNIVFSDFISV